MPIDLDKWREAGLTAEMIAILVACERATTRVPLKGDPGRGIANIRFDDDSGSLVIQLTDGSSEQTSDLRSRLAAEDLQTIQDALNSVERDRQAAEEAANSSANMVASVLQQSVPTLEDGYMVLTLPDGAVLTWWPVPAGGAALAAPAVIAAPTISGGTTEGSILTRTAGDASGNPAPARETVWLLDGVAIAGQTGDTLDTTGRVGVITTQDIWTNSEGTATGTSDAVTTTLAQPDPIVIAARAYPTDFGTLDY
ncbi:MAG: hypothetical protein ACU0DM_12130, partial [Paracoccus sp. (in: a-proteobacteria)]